jgi:phosphoglycolate phosphatase
VGDPDVLCDLRGSRPLRTALAVFDLDGTLVDSRRDLADSANAMLASYGAPPMTEDAVASMVGCGAATLVRRLIEASGVRASAENALARFLNEYDQRLVNHTRPYSGIPPLLARLHAQGVTMAVLTNKPSGQSVKILEAFELWRYFRWTVGGDGPWPRKPAPEGLWHLMEQSKALPARTLLIGDSSVDLATSRNAGVRVCLVRYGFGFAEIDPGALDGHEWVVDSPAEIARAVSRLALDT